MDGNVLVPKDFTSVCPTEVAEFNKNFDEFKDRDTILYGASTDSEFVHLAWRKDPKDLRDLKFPLIAIIQNHWQNRLEYLKQMKK